jgi:hypothetical protein
MSDEEGKATAPVDVRERASVALGLVRQRADQPLALFDPMAMVSLLEWVVDGRARPFGKKRADARADAIGAAIRAGAGFTISAPSISPRGANDSKG